jgi:hypothetical protein
VGTMMRRVRVIVCSGNVITMMCKVHVVHRVTW